MEIPVAVGMAFWFGILTSIGPCPLATNIAAVSFVSRKAGSARYTLGAGVCYMLGRVFAYSVLGMLLVRGVMAAPALSHGLQKYMNLLMGPLLILVAMVLLKLIALPAGKGFVAERFQAKIEKAGFVGAVLLGIVFSVAFCPTSAALFFGSLLPLAVKTDSGVLLPCVYGVATGLPVLFSALLLAFGVNRMGSAFKKMTVFEMWAQRVTGVIFLGVGIFFTVTVTLMG